jgi:hypothetical protein
MNDKSIYTQKTRKLFQAITKNNVRLVKQLLEEGTPTTLEDRNCLVYALSIERYNETIVNLLLEYDAELAKNNEGKTAIEVLTNYAVDGTPEGVTPDSCWRYIIELAKKKKTHVLDAANYGYALHYAVRENKQDVARALLEAGAPPDKYEKKNCLYWAVTLNYPQLVNLLLQYGAELTPPDLSEIPASMEDTFVNFGKKMNAISKACAEGDLKQVQQLIARGYPSLVFNPNFNTNLLILTIRNDKNNKAAIFSCLLQAMPNVPLKIARINETLQEIKEGLEAYEKSEDSKPSDQQISQLTQILHCQEILHAELYRYPSLSPREKNRLLSHGIHWNRALEIKEIMKSLHSLNDPQKFAKIFMPDSEGNLLQLASQLSTPGANEFFDSLVNLLLALAKNSKLNTTEEFRGICGEAAQIMYSTCPYKPEDSSEGAKTYRVWVTTLFVLAGDKANAALKYYSYQSLLPGKHGLDPTHSMEKLFGNGLEQALEDSGLKELAATNSTVANELAKLYFDLRSNAKCQHYLALAHQQSPNDPAVTHMAKQLIAKIFLTEPRSEKVAQIARHVLESGNQEELMKFLDSCYTLVPPILSKLGQDPSQVDDNELQVIAKISKEKKTVYGALLGDEESKLISFYHYAVRVIQGMAYDDPDAIKHYPALTPAHRDCFFKFLVKKGTPRGIDHLIQDAIKYQSIELMLALVQEIVFNEVAISNNAHLMLIRFVSSVAPKVVEDNQARIRLFQFILQLQCTGQQEEEAFSLLMNLALSFIRQLKSPEEVSEFVQGATAYVSDKQLHNEIAHFAATWIEVLSKEQEEKIEVLSKEQEKKPLIAQCIQGTPSNYHPNLFGPPPTNQPKQPDSNPDKNENAPKITIV